LNEDSKTDKMNKIDSHNTKKSNKRIYAIFLLLMTGLFFTTCIEEYNPDITDDTELLVIDGSIVKGDSVQTISVSWSTSVDDSYYNPVSGCTVWATNGQGTQFIFNENNDEYTAVIPDEYLAYNSEFKITVVIPNGNQYESDYETIYESSVIDSLYYGIANYQSSTISSYVGLQFYADLKANEASTKNYMWILEETWETHAPYLIAKMEYSESGEVVLFDPPTDSLQVCYDTQTVNETYTASTDNLASNEKKKIQMRYMADTNYKINYNYSILVKQYALTEAAYDYWSQLQVLSSESGGLYQAQPSTISGNICNVNDADEVVLGYFWAASYTQQRINYKGPLTEYNSAHICMLETLDPDNPPYGNPVYYSEYGTYADAACFNCTAMDGTLTKPDFFE
jgi:hypothetical protein